MNSPRRGFTIAAVGASLVAFTALGSAGEKREETQRAGARPCCCTSAGATQDDSVLVARRDPDADPPAAPKAKAKASPAATMKGVATRKALLAQVSALMEDGVADCCIDPGCGFCVIAADGCGCAGSLAKGGPVCPECWGGWRAEQGMLPGVKPENVKMLPKDQLKRLYDLRAKKLEEADQG